MADLEAYKTLVDRLKTMVDDPHPGLSTWTELFGRNVVELYELWSPRSQNVSKHEYVAAVVPKTGERSFPIAICTNFAVANELERALNKGCVEGSRVKVVPIEEVPL